MKRALGYGLVLLAATGAGTRVALAMAGGGAAFAGSSGAAAHGSAPGYLGVDLRDISEDQAPALKLKVPRGAEIVLVDHDAPAGKCGLHEHDVVLQLNGQLIENSDQIRRMLHDQPPGKTITLLISRDGLQMTFTAQMAANREELERRAWEQHLTVPEPQVAAESGNGTFYAAPSSPSPAVRGGSSFIGTILMSPAYTGAMLEQMSTQLAQYFGVSAGAGLLVRSVADNSPAAQAGMRAGDVIVRANAQKVSTTGDWTKAIKGSKGRPLNVTVLREKKEQTLTLTPDPKRRSSLEELIEAPERTLVSHLGFPRLPRS